MTAGNSEYKRTLMDDRGPEAPHRNQILRSLVIPVVAGALIGGALATKNDLSPPVITLITVGGALVVGACWWLIVSRTSRGAAASFSEFVPPSRVRTPYEERYSEQDAMVMRGEVARALASYEEIILASPNDPAPRIRAADLYARNRQRERAEALYKAVQRLPNVAAEDDIYVSNRLVDLYLQWPDREARALTELRRIMDTYPDSDVAGRARIGLANLKSQLGAAE